MDSVVIMLACNDCRNGVFTGLCDTIEVLPSWRDAPLLQLNGMAWRCSEHTSRLQIGHVHLHVLTSKEWYGNWCWNAYEVPIGAAGRLIAQLHKSPRWGVEEGEHTLYDAFAGPALSAKEWTEHLRHMSEQEEGLSS